jgi:IS30 family transposase
VEKSAMPKAKEKALSQLARPPRANPARKPLSERPAHIEGRKQVGHWECDTVIGVNNKQATVTVVKCKSGYAMIGETLKVTGYFARPFTSWKRGYNESFKDFLHQYVPNKRPMRNIND